MPIETVARPPLRTEIAGTPICELVERFGTPTYVYDSATILERIESLRSFDVIRYAQKACSNLAILDLMRRQGVMVDAVSAGEIQRALKAGYEPGGQPPGIVYTADIFDHDALRMVLEYDLHVNVGSPDMIDQLGQAAPGKNITLRLNPGFGHGLSQKTNTGGEHSKHGIWYEQLEDCLLRGPSWTGRDRIAYAYRFRDRHGAFGARLRGHERCSAAGWPLYHIHQRWGRYPRSIQS